MSHTNHPPIVDGQNLTKSYDDLLAVDDLSISVGAGEIVGLLGPNGAGKTTTIRMLTTLLPIDQGSARVAGYDVATQGDHVRSSIGLAGQAAAVDEKLTARENLDLFARLYHLPKEQRIERVETLVDKFRLDEFADRPVGTLSGGQRRRVDIVASLIAHPPAVFLDEPTTGLDPRSRLEIWEEIRLLAEEGSAVVLTTQYLDEADQLADRIILLDRGRVVAEGSQAELKNRLEEYVLEIHLANPDDMSRALSAMDGAEAHRPDERTIQVQVGSAANSLAVLDSIRDAGVELADFSLRKPTLDDVFLAFTDA